MDAASPIFWSITSGDGWAVLCNDWYNVYGTWAPRYGDKAANDG